MVYLNLASHLGKFHLIDTIIIPHYSSICKYAIEVPRRKEKQSEVYVLYKIIIAQPEDCAILLITIYYSLPTIRL